MTKPNLGRQRTIAGSYSGQSVERNTSKVLGDVPYYTGTRDKVRDAGGGSELAWFPGPTPNNYVAGDGLRLGKRLTHPDIDPDGSRALQKDWHRKAGFSQEVNRADNHPSKGTTNMKSRGVDSGGSGQGGPKCGFSWQ